MFLHIAHTKLFLRTTSFPIKGILINNLTSMKNCSGVQGSLNWTIGYMKAGSWLTVSPVRLVKLGIKAAKLSLRTFFPLHHGDFFLS